MTKHSIPILAAPILILSLASCGGKEESATPAAETAEAPAAKKPGPAPAEQVDLVQLGRRYFTVCAVCHTTEDGAAPRQGPNLKGVYGAPSARLPDYNYSSAMRAANLMWTEENLDAYIANPQKVVPGANMAFAGERNPEKRKAIIAYLKSLSDDETSTQ